MCIRDRVPSCQNRVPTETRRNPIWPDGTRRALTDHSTVPYQCTTDVRTFSGPYGALTDPDGTQPNPSSLIPDRVRQRATRNAGAQPPPLLARAPRDGITACDQVPHSDLSSAHSSRVLHLDIGLILQSSQWLELRVVRWSSDHRAALYMSLVCSLLRGHCV